MLKWVLAILIILFPGIFHESVMLKELSIFSIWNCSMKNANNFDINIYISLKLYLAEKIK